jgi:hypothetical protein
MVAMSGVGGVGGKVATDDFGGLTSAHKTGNKIGT